MFKIDGIKHFINKTFRDKIINVEPPREDWFEYGGQLIFNCYIVPVTYKYAGVKNFEFEVFDDEGLDPDFEGYSEEEQRKLCEFSRRQTLKCAKDFYLRTLEQVKENRASKTR